MSLPRYPEYKDSGVRWLGEVPAHWALMRLRRCVRLNPSKSEVAAMPRDLEVSFLPMEAVGDDGSLSLERERPIQEVETGYTYFRDGDVAFAKITPCFENGKGALMTGLAHGVGFGTTELIVARPISGLMSSAFLHWIFRSPNFRSEGEASMYGAGGQKRVPDDFVRELLWAVPPDSERERIATFLDRETAKIDALIAEQEKLLALLAEKRQATISHAVTRGLNPNASMRDSGIPWLGEVPAHWLIGGLTKFIGPVVDYRGRTPAKGDAGTFLVTAKNVRNGAIDYAASEEYVDPVEANALLSRGRPEVGDVLFTTEAPLGQVAQIDRTDIALAQRIVKFRGLEGVLLNRFLMYWLMGSACQSRLETLATGSTALGIKASKLGMIECLVPPIPEQQKIVGHIDRQLSQFTDLEVEAVRGIDLLRERRSALISAAVTGKIDVRHAV